MSPLTVTAGAILMSWSAVTKPVNESRLVLDVVPTDTIVASTIDSTASATLVHIPESFGYGLGIADPARFATTDTLQQTRAKAFVYSDGYYTRLTWHRRLSYTMLPLFAVSYFSGDQLLKKGRDAPNWARSVHGPAASGSAILFGVNTLTGGWNLWEGRHDPAGRTKRIVHSVLFAVASGGFAYAGTKLASDAQESQDKRLQHRNVAIASMGVSTASWLMMLLRN